MVWILTLLSCNLWTPPPPPAVVAPESQDRVVPAVLPAPIPDQFWAASHVLVSWQGADRAPEHVQRTEEEARGRADEVHGRAVAGEELESLAVSHSDGASSARGGQLGAYRTGTMVPVFEAAVASLDVGEVAPVVRSPFGYHVIRRDPVQLVSGRHIVVRHSASWQSTSQRSLAEAEEVMGLALAELETGRPFEAVAATYSEDATAEHGGHLGTVMAGQLVPAVEDVLFELEPGERSHIFESSQGLHLLERLDLPKE